ncbi:hypothetical protein BKA83DRAFT_372310 [Pisolithus microcarpus]|nr:hypothetical protein BKA83DRAFT_372310 [Pisolithus microcarpus]
MRSIPVDTSTGVVFQVLFMMGVRTTDGHDPGVYFSICSRPTVEIPEPFPSKTNGKVAGPEYPPDECMTQHSLRFRRRTHAGTSEFRVPFSPSRPVRIYASTIPIDDFSTRYIALSRSPQLAGSTLSDQIAALFTYLLVQLPILDQMQ